MERCLLSVLAPDPVQILDAPASSELHACASVTGTQPNVTFFQSESTVKSPSHINGHDKGSDHTKKQLVVQASIVLALFL